MWATRPETRNQLSRCGFAFTPTCGSAEMLYHCAFSEDLMLSDVTSATSLQDILGSRSDAISIYIKYDRLEVRFLRSVLYEIQRNYDLVDKHLVAQRRDASPRPHRTHLAVQEAHTGQSVLIVLAGDPAATYIFGLIIKVLHSGWGAFAGGATVIGASATAAVELRKKWYEGDKNRAESKKLAAETRKIELETEAALAGAERDQTATIDQASRVISFIHIDEPEAVAGRLGDRLKSLGDTPGIRSLEISVGSEKLAIGSGKDALTTE
jgi:hypothetical protein